MKRWLALVAVAVAELCAGQVAVTPIVQPHQTFADLTGSPCAMCKLYSYAAGTTTPLATYTDSSGTSQNTNPIILDVAGGANIWVASSSSYKFRLTDANGSTIWTVDDVRSNGIGILPGCNVVGNIYAPTLLKCIPNGGTLNLQNYVLAAGGTYAGDVTSVMDSLLEASYLTRSTIYIPAGDICFSHQETIIGDMVGDGRNVSIIRPCMPTSIPANQAIVRMCYKNGEIGSHPNWDGYCPSNIRYLGIIGLGQFPSTLTGSTSDLGDFQGDCLEIDEYTNNANVEEAKISSCNKGIRIDVGGGHVNVRDTLSNSSFYNVYSGNGSGDFKFINDDFAGTLFASMGATAVDNPPVAASGFVGITLLNTHLGFGPYGVYVPDGAGANGLIGFVAIHSPWESIGNSCIYIGTRTNGDNLRSIANNVFIQSGCAFGDPAGNYAIKGNPSFPVQDYGLTLDFINGPNVFDPTSGWPIGTSGFKGKIRHPQNPIYVGLEYDVQFWDGSNVLASEASGVILPNKTSRNNACSLYVSNNGTTGVPLSFQDIKASNDCYFDGSNQLNLTVPLQALAGVDLSGSITNRITSKQGNSQTIMGATGSFTNGDLTSVDSNGNLVDAAIVKARVVQDGGASLPIGKVACVKNTSPTTLGYCSDQPNVSGNCTCN